MKPSLKRLLTSALEESAGTYSELSVYGLFKCSNDIVKSVLCENVFDRLVIVYVIIRHVSNTLFRKKVRHLR
jgi:hypothetical protein